MLRKTKLLGFSATLLALLSRLCDAEQIHQHEHGDGEKLGYVHFPISCNSAAQVEFDRAVAMLHSFWYEKAGQAFTEVARKDPSCAMAYWGLAMTFYHPLWESPNAEALKNGWAAVEKARTIGATNERERDYIAAIETFYKDYASTDHVTRALAYEKAMEQLHSRYPDDHEAAIFYSLALIASAQTLPADKTYAREKKAAGILNEVLSKETEHPGAIHYLIHAYDSPPLANLALNAARNYAKIAPAVPHALHMPSHIFTRLGLWQESVQSNIASEAAAKKFAAETHMEGAWDEQLHAMDYLMYAYLQGAQDNQAKAVLDELYQISKTTPESFKVAYAFTKLGSDPFRLLLIPSAGGAKSKTLTNTLDLWTTGLEWGDEGRGLYWLTNIKGENHVFRVDVASEKLSQVTSGARFINALNINDETRVLAYTASDFQHPSELYVAKLDGTQEKQLTHLNQALLSKLEIQPVERMSYKSDDGLSIDGFLVKPVGWQEGKKYPMILWIHGGPEAMFGTNWMITMQVFAAHGWGAFYTNPRGSTGYGAKFMKAGELEWGGKIYTDLMTGVDTVVKQNAWIDADKLGVSGCSFGGYMTNWIVSHTNRFKAAVPMCSISDLISVEGTRAAYYGHAGDFGGDLYQNFDLFWKYSPIHYAMNVKTPTLILHGESDQIVPLEQPEQWFRALRHFHVTSEFVIFPHEFHGGLFNGEPRHVVEAMNWQTYWFNRYLDGNSAALPPDAIKKDIKSVNAKEN